ncbi:MAG TPA: diacylglycerol kinase [Gammaproteobacteria bacterium]|nr:diacylglycerol kinase [Gammaproteobacteria bacterium]
MNDSGNGGLRRLISALAYSWAGLKSAFRHEEAFRQEVALVVVLAPVGLWLGQTGTQRALLLGALLLVPIVELLNSSIEAAVDRIGDERHPLAGRAKDMGSAAVLFALLNAGAVWALVLLT